MTTAQTGNDTADQPVQFAADGAIARLILNRPAKRNAVSPDMAVGLEAALDRLEGSPELRVGVISGAGDAAFCAGADLGYVARGGASGSPRNGAGSPGSSAIRAASRSSPRSTAMRWPAGSRSRPACTGSRFRCPATRFVRSTSTPSRTQTG